MRVEDVVYKTLRLIRISLLISAITKSFAFFLGKVILRVCITVSNSPNPWSVYIRLCKHGKRFLLLKCYAKKLLLHDMVSFLRIRIHFAKTRLDT